MAMLVLVRHGQASFGAADYDVLSDLGHRQARAVGAALAKQGLEPARIFVGNQRRHRETAIGILSEFHRTSIGPVAGETADPAAALEVHPGLDEFDFRGLLDARFATEPRPEGTDRDRKTHFRILRDTVQMWRRNEIAAPPESFAAFTERVGRARDAMADAGDCVLAVSSGGPIARMVALVLDAPAEQMIHLQLQMRNCGVTRFVSASGRLYLHGFNETPHVQAADTHDLLSYS